jgi:hypothetical protein
MTHTEPVRLIAILTALVTASIGVAAAFGLDLDDSQRTAVLACVPPVAGLIVAGGEWARSRVWAAPNHEHAVDLATARAYVEGADDTRRELAGVPTMVRDTGAVVD